jgi:RES domain-containing protein
VRLWRLINPRHAPGLDGEGSRRFGGRWNTPGRPIVYTSDAPALAALELFVNLEADQRTLSGLPPLSLVAIQVEDDLIAHPFELPTEYADQQRWGDAWLAQGAELAVAVPSKVIRWEVNVLLNPRHPDMARVKVISIDPFQYDSRLLTP